MNGSGALGITNESTSTQTINNNATGSMFINNESTIAGGVGVTLNNRGSLTFSSEANAGTSSTIINNLGVAGAFVFGFPSTTIPATNATINFNANSTAGDANINNTASDNGFLAGAGNATINFNDNSTAGTANIINTAGNGFAGTGGTATINFNDRSAVGSAEITNNAGTGTGGAGGTATINFNDNSTVGSAAITNNAGTGTGGVGGTATINFNDDSTIGSAEITNNAGNGALGAGGAATVNFNNTSDTQFTVVTNNGGDASIIAGGGTATTNFSGTSGADRATIVNNGGNGTGAGAGGAGITNFNSGANVNGSLIINNGGDGSGAGIGGAATTNFNSVDADSFVSGDGSSIATTIVNQGGNAADAGIGGAAITTFSGTASATDSIITNTGGVVTSGTGIGGFGITYFNDDSTAATAFITNNEGGLTAFDDNANAGLGVGFLNQAIIINNGGTTTFLGDSSAGTANILNYNDGATTFFGDATAADSVINNGDGISAGTTTFNGNSTAANSLITNADGSTLTFNGASDAGIDRTRAIQNLDGGTIIFNDTSDAGSASTAPDSEGVSIRNQSGGSIFFNGNSTADDATIRNDEDAVVDIAGVAGVDNDIRIGSLSGGGNVVLGANDLFVGNLGNDDEISGVISGTGSLTKEGTGTLELWGDNTYTGLTDVTEGTLSLFGDLDGGPGGSLAGSVIVRSGATFEQDFSNVAGSVTIEADGLSTFIDSSVGGNVVNNGRLEAIDSISYLNVGGDFTNGAGSVLHQIVDGYGDGSVINAGGAINLGGSLYVEADSFWSYGLRTEYLVAEGATRTGTFDEGIYPSNGEVGIDPTSDIPLYLNPTLEYDLFDGSNVYLYLTRTTLSDIDEGNFTQNQRSLFNPLNDAVEAGDPAAFSTNEDLINAILLSSNRRAALDRAGGDALAVFPVASQRVADRFNERMRAQSLLRLINLARIAEGKAPRLVYTGIRYSQLLNNDSASVESSAAQSRSNLWASIARAHDDGDSDGNGPGFEARATEFQIGVDRNISDRTVLGLSLGKSDGKVDVGSRAAEGDLDTTSVGVYLRHEADSFYATGSLSYSRHNIDSERFTGIGDAEADFDGRTIGLQAEVGKRTGRGSYSIEPNINLHLANTKQDGYTESGPGGLSVDSARYNTRRLGLGVRIVNRDAAARIRPFLSLGYQREFGDTQAELTNQLTGLSAFNVSGANLGKNIWSARLGADARLNDRFSVVGEIGASWRKNQDSRYIYGGVKYGW